MIEIIAVIVAVICMVGFAGTGNWLFLVETFSAFIFAVAYNTEGLNVAIWSAVITFIAGIIIPFIGAFFDRNSTGEL